MYAFLLLLGAVITAAGLGLVASGVSIQDHTFDATNVLPAMIAVIGGCILIALSFVVRALQRVERALMARPMPRPARVGELGSTAPLSQANEEARILFPVKPKAPSYLQPAPPAARPASATGKSPEALQEAVPLVVEESDVSLLPKAPVRRLDEENGDVDRGVSGRPNGSAQVKTAARVTVATRPVRRPLQPQDSTLNNLWPMAPASAPPKGDLAPAVKVQVAAPQAAPQVVVDGSQPTPQAPPAEVQQEAPAPVSVLKSGVVEGMAYTLYSDGSIEAQLPGGMVRFGSITELRNHIEKNG
jgi:hypothetical protein